MQKLHTAEISIPVRYDGLGRPPMSEFVKSLEQQLEYWKTRATEKDYYHAIDYGVVMTRHDDSDVWCH